MAGAAEPYQGVIRGVLADDDEAFLLSLQERIQERWHSTPAYRIVRASGPAHAPAFHSEVLLDGEVIGTGTGTTRKQAEQEAARMALDRVEEER